MRSIGFLFYLLLVVSWFLHVPARIEFLGKIRFDVILMALCSLSLLLSGGSPVFKKSGSIGKNLTFLLIYIVLSMPLVEWPGSVLRHGLMEFSKVLLFYFFTAGFIDSEKKLGHFLFIFIGCQIFRYIEPVYLHLTQGYWGSVAHMRDAAFMNRLSGAPSDVINPNGLAFVILTAFPFLYYEAKVSWIHKLRFLIGTPLAVYALMLTGSRSGLLGLLVLVLMIFFKSRNRLLLGLCIVAGGLFVSAHLTRDLSDRYDSIFDKNSENAVTFQGRIEGMRDNLRVFLHRPVFGYGLGTSAEANGNYGAYGKITHNLYLEVAQELGIIGLLIYLFFLKAIWDKAKQSIHLLSDSHPEGVLLKRTHALQIWVVMNLVFSMASYGLSTYEWYLFAGLAVCLSYLANQAASSTSRMVSPISSSSYELEPMFPLSTGKRAQWMPTL